MEGLFLFPPPCARSTQHPGSSTAVPLPLPRFFCCLSYVGRSYLAVGRVDWLIRLIELVWPVLSLQVNVEMMKASSSSLSVARCWYSAGLRGVFQLNPIFGRLSGFSSASLRFLSLAWHVGFFLASSVCQEVGHAQRCNGNEDKGRCWNLENM